MIQIGNWDGLIQRAATIIATSTSTAHLVAWADDEGGRWVVLVVPRRRGLRGGGRDEGRHVVVVPNLLAVVVRAVLAGQAFAYVCVMAVSTRRAEGNLDKAPVGV